MKKNDIANDIAVELPETNTEEIVYGYRVWAMNEHTGRLEAIGIGRKFSNIGWPTWQEIEQCRGLAKAECNRYSHLKNKRRPIPDENCSCGYHATKTIPDYGDLAHLAANNDDNYVLGKIAMWGRIIEHDEGYRAEFAYPQVLYYPFHSNPNNIKSRIIRNCASVYGCDVAPWPTEISHGFKEEKKNH